MKKNMYSFLLAVVALLAIGLNSCKKNNTDTDDDYPAIAETFGDHIDLNNLPNYENQNVPSYITKDNTNGNVISNKKATLGRVLFYDKNLSIDNSVSCSSCHLQQFAFGDTALASHGVESGLTHRHSMRLINARFADEVRFFWNERVASLEEQTTKPMQDHAEMGYSGQDGRPDLDDLINKLEAIDYYQEFFRFVYGNDSITEEKMQECLAQFVRSIQSFDSKYDAGRAQVANDGQNFPNFTAQENAGKQLFLAPPGFDPNGHRISGGIGCAGCHRPPEFDIDPATNNNGIFFSLGSFETDVDNTKAPSLRDVASLDGQVNTPLMHTGSITSLASLLLHYGNIHINSSNTRLDRRLSPNGFGQQLDMTDGETAAVIAFLKTLTGNDVYTNEKWSSPFQ